MPQEAESLPAQNRLLLFCAIKICIFIWDSMKVKDGFKNRVYWVYAVIFLFGAILTTRLFFIQVVKKEHYQNLANQQYAVPVTDFFSRGGIYFNEKGGKLISAASLKNGFEIAINPSLIDNPENVYKKISDILKISKEDFLKRADKKSDPYEIIASRVAPDAARMIKDLKISGLNAYSENWRYYPAENLASHVLGYVGYQDGKAEPQGCYGLEKQYEQILSCKNENVMVNSFAEIFTDIAKTFAKDSKEGVLVLTIEPAAQSALEKNLEKLMQKYGAKMAGGIIIEPKTGKILAMASRPDFNPNLYSQSADIAVFRNSGVSDIFEMGSIMKPLTLAAAMDQGKITADTIYFDKGFLHIDGSRIENYDGKARGEVSMQEVLNSSLNTGAVFAMEKLGKTKFSSYLLDYGFGEKTGIDLPGEEKGMIENVINSPRNIEYATASYGQGFAITPVQMAVALSSLANGGYLMRPYIVEEIKTQNGQNEKIKPKIRRQVLKKETSEQMSGMLAKVFDKALMGGIYKMEHYSIAAKTGTAQLSKEGESGYEEENYVHTFFGYAPAYDARFLILLYMVKPQGVLYASHSLSEPFVNIIKFLLNYYEVPPDR